MLDHMNLAPLVEALTPPLRRPGRKRLARRPIVRALASMTVEGIASVSELARRLDNESSMRKVCGFSEYAPLDTFRRVRRDLEVMGEVFESLVMETIERIDELIEMEEGSPYLGQEVAVDATTVRSNSNGNRTPPQRPRRRLGHRQQVWFQGRQGLGLRLQAPGRGRRQL